MLLWLLLLQQQKPQQRNLLHVVRLVLWCGRGRSGGRLLLLLRRVPHCRLCLLLLTLLAWIRGIRSRLSLACGAGMSSARTAEGLGRVLRFLPSTLLLRGRACRPLSRWHAARLGILLLQLRLSARPRWRHRIPAGRGGRLEAPIVRCICGRLPHGRRTHNSHLWTALGFHERASDRQPARLSYPKCQCPREYRRLFASRHRRLDCWGARCLNVRLGANGWGGPSRCVPPHCRRCAQPPATAAFATPLPHTRIFLARCGSPTG